MEILLTIFYAAIFIILIFRMKFFIADGLSKKIIAGIFILKIFSGLALLVIYTYYYTDRSTADIFKYFDDSKVMYDALWEKPIDFFRMISGIACDNDYFNQNYYSKTNHWFKPWDTAGYNDNRTLIRFNALVRIFSFGYFNVHTVFMNFISLTGLVAIYKTFVFFLQEKKKELGVAVFFIPSVMFWSSGVLKEGILFFSLGMLVYQYFNFIENKFSVSNILLALLSVLVLLILKIYILMIFFPLMIAYYWTQKTAPPPKESDTRTLRSHRTQPSLIGRGKTKNTLLKYICTLAVCALLGLNIHHIVPDYNFLEVIAQKQNDFINLSDSLDSGSRIDITRLKPEMMSVVKNIPEALNNTFLRPFIWESKSPFILMAAAENTAIVLFGLSCLIFHKRWREINFNLLLLLLLFVLLLFLLIGWTTPVLGAIARYKVPALPFLLIAFLLILNEKSAGYRKLFFKSYSAIIALAALVEGALW